MPSLWSGNDAPIDWFRISILGMHRVSDLQGDQEGIAAGPMVMKQAVEWLP